MNTTVHRPARTEAEQRARIRFAAHRAALEAQQATNPLEPAVRDAEHYSRRLNGGE